MVLRDHFSDEWQLSISSQSRVWEFPQCGLQIAFFQSGLIEVFSSTKLFLSIDPFKLCLKFTNIAVT